jgi:membrane peptidoglycan carboxypeptidase
VLRADWTSLASSKTSAVGRLLLFSAVAGVLVAALIVPVVASTGILIRNTADKFTTLQLTGQNDLPSRSEILNRDGQLITYVYGVDLGQGMTYTGINRDPIAYDQIAPVMLQAIVAIEDNTYWSEGALDVRSEIRAIVNDLKHQPIQGASTIAQQYVKNVLILSAPDPQAAEDATADTLSRKLNQLRMAVDAEHNMTKQQILDGYLNDAYFGNGAYGIEAAAETYFGTTAANLTVDQAATLAGIVENPSAYDPITNPSLSLERRNTVLARMWQTNNGLTKAQASAAEAKPLATHPGQAQNGCTASTVGDAGYFCDYVEHVLLEDDTALGTTPAARAKELSTGGLTIKTTLNPSAERTSTDAVNHVLPEYSNVYNPARNADTQVLIQPGTGQVLSIAENRHYGTSSGDTEVDYAVGSQYGGADGVQTGSSSKLFTLVTALEQGIPFGYTETVPSPTTVTGFTNCEGAPAGQYNGEDGAFYVINSEGDGTTTNSLYTGTANSINVFFGQLEQKVGLCNVVHTAVNLGMTYANGGSLLKADPAFSDLSADNYPGFTLGELPVTPLQMAAAYATMAAQGRYCSPIVLTGITNAAGRSFAVPSSDCHQAVSSTVANAVNYILQGTIATGTAAGYSLPDGRESAGKTGTSNVASGNGTPYAAFAGYTPNLASYTSVFNPISPTVNDTMAGESACYDSTMPSAEGQDCPAEMYGANAPASTWYYTFTHFNLGSFEYFTAVPQSSSLWSKGTGLVVAKPPTKTTKNNGGGGNGNPGHKTP